MTIQPTTPYHLRPKILFVKRPGAGSVHDYMTTLAPLL